MTFDRFCRKASPNALPAQGTIGVARSWRARPAVFVARVAFGVVSLVGLGALPQNLLRAQSAPPAAVTAAEIPFAPIVALGDVSAWVMTEHPLAQAADAVAARGPAGLLAARGAFDPRLAGDFSRKQFLGTEYFEYAEAGVEWQSPYGAKLEVGRQWAEGVYINPELRVPDAGQAYISVKVPLLQGLLFDKYRLGVAQGEVDVALNRAAAEVIRNELHYDLAVAYAEWAYAYRALEISVETESLIGVRLANTRGLYQQGDRPAVDTLEARIALANQELTTQQALVDVQVAAQMLRAIYWVLPQGALPPPSALRPALPVDTFGLARHPALTELRARVAGVELDRRLYREYRKPRLDASYSLLGDGFDLTPANDPEGGTNFLTSAYKVGLTFRYPILNRQARGQLQIADLKLAETGAKLEAKRRELDAKAQANYAAAIAFERQLGEVERLIAQSRALLAAERELFGLGESTQFLLNSREQSLQKALQTAAKIEFSRAKAIYAYRQATANWE